MFTLAMILALVSQQPGETTYSVVKYYKVVTDDGLHVTVKGWIKPGDRRITWEPDDPFNAKAVAEAREKAAVPAQEPRQAQQAPSYATNGVMRTGKRHDAYTLPSEEARRFVADVKANAVSYGYGSDGSAKSVHVTVIGTEEERNKVTQDLANHKAFEGIRDRFYVQAYEPGNWAVDKSLGFQPGSPTILVQTGKSASDPRGGKVIYRVADYSRGPEPIAEAIRKACPDYDPSKDPGSEKASGKCPLGLSQTDAFIGGAVVVAVFLLLGKRKE